MDSNPITNETCLQQGNLYHLNSKSGLKSTSLRSEYPTRPAHNTFLTDRTIHQSPSPQSVKGWVGGKIINRKEKMKKCSKLHRDHDSVMLTLTLQNNSHTSHTHGEGKANHLFTQTSLTYAICNQKNQEKFFFFN